MTPLISICIPAYKRTDFLQRLLDSILCQTFKDFEVVITDDSPTNEVELLCKKYEEKFKVSYCKNKTVLGSPENWNEAIRRAEGSWIKLMHDDDWFVDEYSLAKFANRISDSHSFIFSGYNNVYLNTDNKVSSYLISSRQKKMLQNDPYNLLKQNFIGHPSTTLIKNSLTEWYDNSFKWVVDIEFYIRYLLDNRQYAVIEEPLINIGISSSQITASVFRNPDVEIPENIRFMKKMKKGVLKNIFVYDYFWRLIRNLTIRNETMIAQYYSGEVPNVLKKIIQHQKFLPVSVLKTGFISKPVMFISYLLNRLAGRL